MDKIEKKIIDMHRKHVNYGKFAFFHNFYCFLI